MSSSSTPPTIPATILYNQDPINPDKKPPMAYVIGSKIIAIIPPAAATPGTPVIAPRLAVNIAVKIPKIKPIIALRIA